MTELNLPPSPDRQRGAVMVVSMLLLLVMTMIALGASQATRMQERMAGNARDHDLALQSAEAGLRAGERLVDNPALTSAPSPCSSGRCQVYEYGFLTGNFGYQTNTWWNANGWYYSDSEVWNPTQPGSGVIRGTNLASAEPRFVIEEMEEVTDTLTVPPTGPPSSRVYYRITAAGQGGTDTAQVVIQSTFARRFN